MKPSSGHFKGTTGSALSNVSPNTGAKNSYIIKKGLDLREHPTKYKQINSKKMKEFNRKAANRTLTKKEYKRREWQKRLNARRQAGIDAFWALEKELIKNNLPTTRNWTANQRAEILSGKKPKYMNVTMQSHHTYSVSKYPHLANIGALIYPVTRNEHLKRWHGNNYKTSFPGIPINSNFKEEF